MELQAARRQILFLKIKNKSRNIWNCQLPADKSFPQNQKQIEKYMELQAARRQILFLKIRIKLRNIWNCQARRQIFSSNQKQIEKYKEGMKI